uniref:Prostaglandin D2 synthase a n=1 Tax=Cyprinus carpio carpio TaxID=630221 RepID=A0A8C1AGW3_CYPCA
MKIALMSNFLLMLLTDIHASVQPQKNFDLQRFAGRWYRVGLAYDSPGFVRYRSRLTVSVGTVEPKENGNVNMTMWSLTSTGCHSKVYIYKKTSVPGVFTYYSTRHRRVKDVTVVETNYTEYALVLKHKKFNKEFTQVALYGRTEKLSTDVMEKFRVYATAQGFPKDSILTPPAAGKPLKSLTPKTVLLQEVSSQSHLELEETHNFTLICQNDVILWQFVKL